MPKPIDKRALDQRLADELQRDLLDGRRPGERLPPIGALATCYGVSINTLRTALLLLQGQGLVELRHGSGTFVAERPAPSPLRPAPHIAVLIDDDILQPRTSWFFTGLTKMVRRRLRDRGVRSRLYLGFADRPESSSHLTCGDFLEDLDAGLIGGVIAVATLPHSDWVSRLRNADAPVVGMSGGSPGFHSRVHIDLHGMITDAVRALADEGRRRLALLGWSGHTPAVAGTDRDPFTAAFRDACRGRGLVSRPEWIRMDIHPGLSGAGWEEFREAWTATQEKPDGLVVCDDMLFQDAAMAILELGIRVPADLAVVTHANKGSGMMAPFPVTRIEFDPADVAEAMVNELIRLRAGGEPTPEPILLGYEITRSAAQRSPLSPARSGRTVTTVT
jgi:DNA-binding LacI/PurR family transcriptional regulator